MIGSGTVIILMIEPDPVNSWSKALAHTSVDCLLYKQYMNLSLYGQEQNEVLKNK